MHSTAQSISVQNYSFHWRKVHVQDSAHDVAFAWAQYSVGRTHQEVIGRVLADFADNNGHRFSPCAKQC